MNNSSQRLAYKNNIKRYLSELGGLSKKSPAEALLLPLETTEEIRENAQKFKEKPCYKFLIGFQEKESEKFLSYVDRLYKNNPNPIYIWTELTNSCGLFVIDSLLEFNFAFDFDANREGVIVLITKDMADEMILDFSIDEESGKEILEVELRGVHWPFVTYGFE